MLGLCYWEWSVVSGQWSVGSGAKPAMAMGPFACSALREKGDRCAGGQEKRDRDGRGMSFGVVLFLLPEVRVLLFLVRVRLSFVRVLLFFARFVLHVWGKTALLG